MKLFILFTLLFLPLFTTSFSAQASPQLSLKCKSLDAPVDTLNLYAENSTPFIEYTWQEKTRYTQMKALSGSELMGQEDTWIVFFEWLAENETFLLTLFNFKTYTVDLGRKYTCFRGTP